MRIASGIRRIRAQMSRVGAVLIAIVAVLSSSGAWAACLGQDLIPEFRSADPQGIDRMFGRAELKPNANGRFWKVEKPGLEPSWLLGTFHSAEALESVTPKIWQTLESARIAIFEVDSTQQSALEERMATDQSFVLDLDGPGFLSLMDDRQAATFRDAMMLRGVEVGIADRMQPWLVAALLGFPACHLASMSEGDDPMDDVLASRATDRGIPTLGLERYDVALDSLNAIPKAELVTALAGAPELLELEEDIFRTNHDLYVSGRIQAINEFGVYLSNRYQPGVDAIALNQKMMVNLLDVRNRAWMPVLLPEVQQGGAFVAVGALHLPGDVGLVELLRAEGFAVTRVSP